MIFSIGQEIRLNWENGSNGISCGARGIILRMDPIETLFNSRTDSVFEGAWNRETNKPLWDEIGDSPEFGNIAQGEVVFVNGFWMTLWDTDDYCEKEFFVVYSVNGRNPDIGDENSDFFRDGNTIWIPCCEGTSLTNPAWAGFRHLHAPNRFFQRNQLSTPGTEVNGGIIVGYWRNVDGTGSNSIGYCVEGEDGIKKLTRNELLGEDFEYRICARCGAEYTTRTDDDDTLCDACRDRHYVTPYHRYALPVRCYSLTGRDNDNRFLGSEIEVEYGGESDMEAKFVVRHLRAKNGEPFVYVSHDGSLTNGFEIITQPATLGYHKSLEKEYESVFKNLIADGYRGHEGIHAGIHVHVNRKYFGDNEEQEGAIMKLLFLIEKFWDEIIIFSRRDYEKSKTYMAKVEDCYSNPKSYFDTFNKTGDHGGHYFALNISNPNTIEFRMFRSTLNINTYMCILEFVDNICKIAKTKSMNEIESMDFFSLLTPRAFEYYKSRITTRRFNEI